MQRQLLGELRSPLGYRRGELSLPPVFAVAVLRVLRVLRGECSSPALPSFPYPPIAPTPDAAN